MYYVGLTGGIGAGKTTVAKLFESFGVPVFYSDEVSKELLVSDSELKSQIIDLFSQEAYVNGELNTKFVAQIIFANEKKRHQMEQLVFPKVREAFQNWALNQKSAYVINESALLFEKKLNSFYDKVILVTADQDIRIERVCKRDQVERDRVLERISAQWKDSKKEKSADFIIINNNIDDLRSECLDIHNKIVNNLNNK